MFKSIAVFLIFLFASLNTAAAQDTPLLILRFQAEQGYTLDDRKAGLSGAVYALSRSASGVSQSLQIAYDARNRPTLLRLVQKIEHQDDGAPFTQAAMQTLQMGQPEWEGAEVFLAEQVEPLVSQFASDGTGGPLSIPLPGGKPGALSFLAADRLAVLDIPANVPEARLLDEESVRRIASDSTFAFPLQDTGPHHRYHAPSGRIGGGQTEGETTETGSWTVEASGRYCIETAPVPSFRCAALYDLGNGAYLSVPIVNDVADGRGMRQFTVVFGNPGGHKVPKRDDATPSAVTQMIVGGQTEERRQPDGAVDRLFLSPDGAYRGIRNGMPSNGHWSVMSDGRRCLTDLSGASECLFLSETDGGTFQLFDIYGNLLGEALYRDGNPQGY